MKLKIMNINTSILFLPSIFLAIFGLSRCGKEELKTSQIAIHPCTSTQFTSTESFENITGTVIKYRRKLVDRDTVVYLVDAPKITKSLAIYIDPCNLPVNVMQEGMKIKFSGHLLSYSDPKLMLNVDALPFELTQINFKIFE